MCDLFGMSCNAKDRATRSLPVFAEKYSGRNCDGWGIAHYVGNNPIVIRKPEKAKTSSDFSKALQSAQSNIIVAHVRYATGTAKHEVNCHPFTQSINGVSWIFAHNGIVDGVPQHSRSQGNTDSEQVFNFMLDKLGDYLCGGRIRGVYPGILYALKQVFEQFGREITLNLLMSDGNILYAFNHYDGKPLYFLRREKEYGGAFLISTQKLSSDEDWEQLPKDRLLLVRRADVLVLSDPI